MQRSTRVRLGILGGFFILTRLVNLTTLPPFNDESIYIHWGGLMITTPGKLFYSLFDGKQPTLMWMFGLSYQIFSDPVFAGRLVSVLFSILSLAGIYFVGKLYRLSRFTVYVSLLLYLVIPFFVFFDRQALMEAAMTAVGIWSFYFLQLYLERLKWVWALILGLVLGLGLLIKSSGLVFVIAGIILLYRRVRAALLVVAMVLLVNLPLIVQPLYVNVFSRGNRYNLQLEEIVKFPLGIWINNLRAFSVISFWYLTLPVVVFLIIGCTVNLRKKTKGMVWWTGIVIVISLLTARGFVPRYVSFLLGLVPILVSLGLERAVNVFKRGRLLTVSVAFLPAVILSGLLIFSPLVYFKVMNFLTPVYGERQSYVTGDTSGYGISETVNFLREKKAGGAIIIAVRLDAGNPENAILAYFMKDKNIGLTHLDRSMFPTDFDFAKLTLPAPIYFVSRSNHLGGLEKYMVEEARFYKPEGRAWVGVHRFEPK